MIKIPSSSLVSAKFDAQAKMADIQLNDAEMKLKYNPAASDVKAVTATGPLTVGLANVVSVANTSAQVASRVAPQPPAQQPPAPQTPAYQYPAQTQANVPPPPEAQQAPVTAPPAVVYQPPYEYATASPYYYYPPDYYSSYYYPPYYYSYSYPNYWPYVGWPYLGFSIGIGPHFHGGCHDHFGFHGGFGAFHGGFGHHR